MKTDSLQDARGGDFTLRFLAKLHTPESTLWITHVVSWIRSAGLVCNEGIGDRLRHEFRSARPMEQIPALQVSRRYPRIWNTGSSTSTSFCAEMRGVRGQNTRGIIRDEGPGPGAFSFTVNDTYPKEQPLGSVPANILGTFPGSGAAGTGPEWAA